MHSFLFNSRLSSQLKRAVLAPDVTNDATEPDVSTLEQADVQDIDDTLYEGTRSGLQTQGRELVQWMPSQLNPSDRLNGLFTTYITRKLDEEWQYISLRLNAKGRKVVVIGGFDIAKKDELAEPILDVMRSIAVIGHPQIQNLSTPLLAPEIETLFGLPVPSRLFGMDRGEFTNYEASEPGLGYSVQYGSDYGSLTLYVYDFGEPDVSSDLRSSVPLDRFNRELSTILQSKARPDESVELRRAFELTSVDEIGPDFLGALVHVSGPRGCHNSGYLLSAKDDKFVKLRLSGRLDTELFDQWFFAVASEYGRLLWPERIKESHRYELDSIDADLSRSSMKEGTITAAEALTVQAEQWLRCIWKSHSVAPRAFTGITRSGEQFMTILNDIPWTRPDHIQRRVFLHWLCGKEEVAAYAYISMVGAEDGSLAVDIVSDDGDNIVEAIMPIVERDDGDYIYDEAQMYHSPAKDREWSPHTRLMEPGIIEVRSFDSGDVALFENWWAELRPKSLWRTVPNSIATKEDGTNITQGRNAEK